MVRLFIVTIIAEGQVIAGKIRLEHPLAAGGMGSVWVAHHLKLDAPVAVKFMAATLAASDTARARFEREARACAQLRSPHVVQVHDYGVEGETPYIVMELLTGEDLAKRLAKRKKLDLDEACRIAEPITKALRRAHEIGLVHRDLKPGNIFIARSHGDNDGDEIVKLLDFGIAKEMLLGGPQSGHVTRSGNLVGSPLYMSPEQIRKSKEVDHRSDLWSLGVILYEMLTGRPPFVEDEIGAVLVAICTDPIPAPSSLDPRLGPFVDTFFQTALARDPASRFQSAREMFEAFAALPRPMETAQERVLATSDATKIKTPIAFTETQAADATLAHADTLKHVGAPGTLTLSPSGQTHGTAARAAEKGQTRNVASLALALVVLAGAAAYFMFGRGIGAETNTSEKDPGSPTLPLPPPTSQPVALVPLPQEKETEIKPEPRLPEASKPVAVDKPAGLASTKAAEKPATAASLVPTQKITAGVDEELGLESPKIKLRAP